jgi:hypothetical protein
MLCLRQPHLHRSWPQGHSRLPRLHIAGGSGTLWLRTLCCPEARRTGPAGTCCLPRNTSLHSSPGRHMQHGHVSQRRQRSNFTLRQAEMPWPKYGSTVVALYHRACACSYYGQLKLMYSSSKSACIMWLQYAATLAVYLCNCAWSVDSCSCHTCRQHCSAHLSCWAAYACGTRLGRVAHAAATRCGSSSRALAVDALLA